MLAQKFVGTCFQKVYNSCNQKTVFIGMHRLKSSLVAKRPKMAKKTSNFKISVSPSKTVKDVYNALDVAFYISRTKDNTMIGNVQTRRKSRLWNAHLRKNAFFPKKKEFFCTFVRFLAFFMLFLVWNREFSSCPLDEICKFQMNGDKTNAHAGMPHCGMLQIVVSAFGLIFGRIDQGQQPFWGVGRLCLSFIRHCRASSR